MEGARAQTWRTERRCGWTPPPLLRLSRRLTSPLPGCRSDALTDRADVLSDLDSVALGRHWGWLHRGSGFLSESKDQRLLGSVSLRCCCGNSVLRAVPSSAASIRKYETKSLILLLL